MPSRLNNCPDRVGRDRFQLAVGARREALHNGAGQDVLPLATPS
jgi:hypothetical protein